MCGGKVPAKSGCGVAPNQTCSGFLSGLAESLVPNSRIQPFDFWGPRMFMSLAEIKVAIHGHVSSEGDLEQGQKLALLRLCVPMKLASDPVCRYRCYILECSVLYGVAGQSQTQRCRSYSLSCMTLSRIRLSPAGIGLQLLKPYLCLPSGGSKTYLTGHEVCPW